MLSGEKFRGEDGVLLANLFIGATW